MQATPIDTITTNAGVDSSTAAFSPDGRFLALASLSSGIQLYDVSTGKWISSIGRGNNVIGPKVGLLALFPEFKRIGLGARTERSSQSE